MHIIGRIKKDEGRSEMYRADLANLIREECIKRCSNILEEQLRVCVQDDSILSNSLKYSNAMEAVEKDIRETKAKIKELQEMGDGDVLELYSKVMSQ